MKNLQSFSQVKNALHRREIAAGSYRVFRRRLFRLVHIAALFGAVIAATGDDRLPNIVFILADDLGYADLGSYGQTKIRTPHLDRMAAEGMRFTQHYSGSAVCAPSRCVLLTGKHPGHAWVRNNQEVRPEGQAPVPGNTVTIAKLLKKAGYTTAVIGKWGLGPPGSEGDPLRQGFDRFYGYNCQRHAHNHYPHYLWDDDRRIELDNPPFEAHQKLPASANPADQASYDPYRGRDYAPDRLREQALRFIRDNRARPFFLYFATPVPHLALQVPEDSVAEYEGQWPDEPYTGDRRYLPHYAPRAAYAAMITRLDRDIGEMMRTVEELGLEKNTLFVFTSDNGPLYDQFGGTDSAFFNSAGPFRGFKGSLYEGGIRVPLIARWKGRIQPGAVSDRVTGFEDWLPTLLELLSEAARGQLEIPPDLDGISFAPTLLGRSQEPRPFLYREFSGYGGQQSVRMGKWKGIRRDLQPRGKKSPDLRIELYDLKADPGESTDIAAAHPTVLRQIEAIMRREHKPSPLFPIAVLDR